MTGDIGGYAKATYKYDKHGNRIEAAEFGPDGQPVLSQAGSAIYQLLNAHPVNDGASVIHQVGYAKLATQYGERGNEMEEGYYGTDGKLIEVQGVARTTFEYDAQGNLAKKVGHDRIGNRVPDAAK